MVISNVAHFKNNMIDETYFVGKIHLIKNVSCIETVRV